jgi:hypothetical protein
MGLVISKGLRLKSYNTPAAIAGVAPTLDYRFALDRREIEAISLTDKLTYTGATNGTFVNRAGLIERATTDQPRFDHGPASRQSLGLLVEDERTNSIRNNTMQGAVAGTPGTLPTNWFFATAAGITSEVVSIGTANGIAFLRFRVSGTPSSTSSSRFECESLTGVAAANGQSWTSSVYLKLHSGAQSNLGIAHRVLGRSSGFTGFNLVESTITLASSFQRSAITTTHANANIIYTTTDLNFTFTSGQAVDCTLDIGLPQLEQGAFATSVIPTTTTALTRPVDSAVIDGTGVITGTYTLVEKPAGCAVVNGSNIDLVSGFTAERVMVFPAALSAPQITAIRGAM